MIRDPLEPQVPLDRLVDAVDCVSFDIFDTAVLRRIETPVDVFAVVEADYRARVAGLGAFDYRGARRAAEVRARERAWQERRATEITFEEIFASLQLPDGWSAGELARAEEEVERELCQRNEYIHRVYRYALARGRRVLFTSDMYLPERTVRAILDEQGYGRYDALYLSSARGRTKSNGDLYHELIAELGVPGNRVLHVGDNYRADVLMARASGLVAYHYRKCATFARVETPSAVPAQAIHRGLTINRFFAERRERPDEDFWFRFGYERAGILYFAFARWLGEELERERFDRVYFVASGAGILKTIYDRLGAGPEAHTLDDAGPAAGGRAAVVALGENATLPRARVERVLTLHGFLEGDGQPAEAAQRTKECVELFELLLAEHDLPPDQLDEAARVQRGALAFVEEMLPLANKRPWLSFTPEVALAPLARVLREPTREEAERLGDLCRAERSEDGVAHRPLARPPAAWEWLRAPRRLFGDVEAARWKEGYRTRLVGRGRLARWLAALGEKVSR